MSTLLVLCFACSNFVDSLELSFNSMGLFIGSLSPMSVLHTVSMIVFHLWCMLRVSVGIE